MPVLAALTLMSAAAPASDYRARLPQDEVIYFLLPDRFENGDPSNDRGGLSGDRLKTGFDPADKGIPMTTTKVDAPRASALAYQQTMRLGGGEQSIFFAFENVGNWAVLGIAFPTQDPSIVAKGALPQTFLDVFGIQAHRLDAR